MNDFPHTPDGEKAAAEWLARRDRGMTAAEQDAYLQWLGENPAHGAEVRRLERTWRELDRLASWRPAHSAQPNPDLLAPPRRRGVRGFMAAAALAAAALAGVLWWPPAPAETPHRQAIIHPGPQRLVLADGSTVELNAGARVTAHFTEAERRVTLESGEAHFAVAKNPQRPFIVTANQVAVRAVGTAFSVSLERQAVSVLVTEGKVRVDEAVAGPSGEAPVARELSHLTAGQQAVVRAARTEEDAVVVRDVTPAEIQQLLSWQGLRLEFVDMSLGDVVREFNRYNQQKLSVADAETAAILVGGNFRADNVETFVRLLDTGFGVKAFPHGNEIMLRRVSR